MLPPRYYASITRSSVARWIPLWIHRVSRRGDAQLFHRKSEQLGSKARTLHSALVLDVRDITLVGMLSRCSFVSNMLQDFVEMFPLQIAVPSNAHRRDAFLCADSTDSYGAASSSRQLIIHPYSRLGIKRVRSVPEVVAGKRDGGGFSAVVGGGVSSECPQDESADAFILEWYKWLDDWESLARGLRLIPTRGCWADPEGDAETWAQAIRWMGIITEARCTLRTCLEGLLAHA